MSDYLHAIKLSGQILAQNWNSMIECYVTCLFEVSNRLSSVKTTPSNYNMPNVFSLNLMDINEYFRGKGVLKYK